MASLGLLALTEDDCDQELLSAAGCEMEADGTVDHDIREAWAKKRHADAHRCGHGMIKDQN